MLDSKGFGVLKLEKLQLEKRKQKLRRLRDRGGASSWRVAKELE